MNKLAPPTRWYAPWRAAVPQDDPADMGTAFGLDLSLAPTADTAIRGPGAAGPVRRGWVRRWVTRRRAAT
jgi:hypothetical protein